MREGRGALIRHRGNRGTSGARFDLTVRRSRHGAVFSCGNVEHEIEGVRRGGWVRGRGGSLGRTNSEFTNRGNVTAVGRGDDGATAGRCETWQDDKLWKSAFSVCAGL